MFDRDEIRRRESAARESLQLSLVIAGLTLASIGVVLDHFSHDDHSQPDALTTGTSRPTTRSPGRAPATPQNRFHPPERLIPTDPPTDTSNANGDGITPGAHRQRIQRQR